MNLSNFYPFCPKRMFTMSVSRVGSSQPLALPVVVPHRYSDTTVRIVALCILGGGIVVVGAIGFGLLSLYRRVTRSANELLSQADALYHQKLFEKAISKYTEALACNPADKEQRAQILIARGKSYSALTSHKEAVKDYSEALASNPADKEQRARLLFARGKTYSALASHEEAVKDYSEALACNPADKELCTLIHYIRGLEYRLLKQNDEAHKDYTAALNSPPDDKNLHAEIFIARANIYFDRHQFLYQYDEAIKDYKAALECNPSDINLQIQIYERRGHMLYKQNDYVAAIANYTEALVSDLPTETQAYFLFRRGNVCRKDELYQEANDDYTKAEACEHMNQALKARILFSKGKLLFAQKKKDEGIEACKEALKRPINNHLKAKILCCLGKMYSDQDKDEQALENFNSALNQVLESDREKILFERACVYHKGNKIQEAKQDIAAALLVCTPHAPKWFDLIQKKSKS
jgi:tetratricopeptide (TPR) repeat protein